MTHFRFALYGIVIKRYEDLRENLNWRKWRKNEEKWGRNGAKNGTVWKSLKSPQTSLKALKKGLKPEKKEGKRGTVRGTKDGTGKNKAKGIIN